jgi:type II secretory pathway pseudopilin PulG
MTRTHTSIAGATSDSTRAPRRHDSRRGFVIPVILVVLVALSISLTGALSFVTSEQAVLTNLEAQEEAFRIAQTGLDEFFANRASLGFASSPPGALESVDIPIGRGTAHVVLERIRAGSADTATVYVVRSTGIIPGPRPTDPDARRTVAQLATFQPATMRVRAGWTSLTGLHKNGAAGTISGVDHCGVAPTVAGVAVPTPPGMTTSGPFSPTGAPGLENLGSVEQAIDSLGIDWPGIRDQSALTPDIVIPGGSWPSFSNPNYWPVIHVTGNFSLPSTGRGILIVTGNLTINGNRHWDGIVLAGQRVTGNGNNTVLGATISGLDAMIQNDPQAWANAQGRNSVGNGTKTYQYSSCNVAQALGAFGGLRPIQNAWMDNWPVDL